MASGVLQSPVAVYLLCKSKRITPSSLVLDISLCADVVRGMHVTHVAVLMHIYS